jgi:beta-galactosidase
VAGELDALLGAGASVNIYMFHGGTSFGLTSGANDKGTYAPIVTSYDYDAPLDEAGHPTAKYWALRDVIAKYAPVPADRPAPRTPAPAFTVPVTQVTPLWTVLPQLGTWHSGDDPVSADELGQVQGFTLYQAQIDVPGSDVTGPPVPQPVLSVGEVRDRAQVFLNRQPVGVLARDHHDRALPLPSGARGTIELLVEDQGRVDYGPRIGEQKGLLGPVTVNGVPVRGWRVMPLPLGQLAPVISALRARPAAAPPSGVAGPAFARAAFDLPSTADLFLSTAGLGKGIAWLNGFCLGRYWSRGPQRTLYVPGPVTRKGENELIILELGATAGGAVEFVSGPDLGHTEH